MAFIDSIDRVPISEELARECGIPPSTVEGYTFCDLSDFSSDLRRGSEYLSRNDFWRPDDHDVPLTWASMIDPGCLHAYGVVLFREGSKHPSLAGYTVAIPVANELAAIRGETSHPVDKDFTSCGPKQWKSVRSYVGNVLGHDVPVENLDHLYDSGLREQHRDTHAVLILRNLFLNMVSADHTLVGFIDADHEKNEVNVPSISLAARSGAAIGAVTNSPYDELRTALAIYQPGMEFVFGDGLYGLRGNFSASFGASLARDIESITGRTTLTGLQKLEDRTVAAYNPATHLLHESYVK